MEERELKAKQTPPNRLFVQPTDFLYRGHISGKPVRLVNREHANRIRENRRLAPSQDHKVGITTPRRTRGALVGLLGHLDNV